VTETGDCGSQRLITHSVEIPLTSCAWYKTLFATRPVTRGAPRGAKGGALERAKRDIINTEKEFCV
jgi:hypothetical protein